MLRIGLSAKTVSTGKDMVTSSAEACHRPNTYSIAFLPPLVQQLANGWTLYSRNVIAALYRHRLIISSGFSSRVEARPLQSTWRDWWARVESHCSFMPALFSPFVLPSKPWPETLILLKLFTWWLKLRRPSWQQNQAEQPKQSICLFSLSY
jgi:hypothetical protein